MIQVTNVSTVSIFLQLMQLVCLKKSYAVVIVVTWPSTLTGISLRIERGLVLVNVENGKSPGKGSTHF